MQLPIPPQMKLRQSIKKDGSTKAESASIDDFVVLSSEDCDLAPSLASRGTSEIFTQLEADLLTQVKVSNLI